MNEHIDNCSIDLTVTSPPYDDLRNYNGYSFNFEKTAKELYRITKKGGVDADGQYTEKEFVEDIQSMIDDFPELDNKEENNE
ncbi:site-specific DNA-methyltransferase [Bacillus paralicheniformis]|uniref:site-specific DNA-methyltransferase n=1 Tax=Bacillus paralicheniformis TaxID=1648923 RepID=UPI00208FD432|nr:site-specific DNA-methyltransferase [Bacillus paralicheniformis]